MDFHAVNLFFVCAVVLLHGCHGPQLEALSHSSSVHIVVFQRMLGAHL